MRVNYGWVRLGLGYQCRGVVTIFFMYSMASALTVVTM